MIDPPPPSRWDMPFFKAQIFSIWGMVALLMLTNLMMLPVLFYRDVRSAFLLFVFGLLAHFFVQFLVSAGLDEISHRRHPRKKRIQHIQCALLLAAAPCVTWAYIF